MKRPWGFLFGLVSGLLGAGLLWLATRPPRGAPLVLQPPPTPSPVVVYVGGAVLHPGLYTLPPGSRVQHAIQAAGGLTADANPEGLNPAARLQDGDRVWVPQRSAPPGQASASQTARINVNRATQSELESLPGIGPVTAQKIIAYREAHGDFQRIEDLLQVPGIGPATLEQIRDLITTGP